jgi:universal stress protein E
MAGGGARDAAVRELKRILVAVGSPEQSAGPVARAAAVARHAGAALRLCACVYEPRLVGDSSPASPEAEAARAAVMGERRAALEALVVPLRETARLEVSLQARWSHPIHDGLLAEATEFGADLLVVRALQDSRRKRAAPAGGDWQLLRAAPCPVLFVRGGGGGDYREILVAVDPLHAHDKPASLDDQLISAACALGRPAGARLQLLHCHLEDRYMPLTAPGAPPLRSAHGHSVATHREGLEALAARHGIGTGYVHLEAGDPRELIPEIARRLGADLVVMGALSRSRLKQLLIGRTAESVLRRLDCDVLAVKP